MIAGVSSRYTSPALMDKLKPFAVPLVALIVLLVWYFVVNPRLGEQPTAADDKAKSAK
jgi:hypothetical protein